MSDKINQLTIKQLFSDNSSSNKDIRYVVPIYQRKYAWKETHIFQLIQDVYDYYSNRENKPYYIGTLIAFEHEDDKYINYEVIDGQQRFTTISLLLDVLKNEFRDETVKSFYKETRLFFESRTTSSKTLQDLFKNEISPYVKYDSAIISGYNDLKKGISSIIPIQDRASFIEYFINKVSIFRVLVPEDTDLNHYFEVMNNRGEQLEKHEILKSYCLQALKQEDRFAFSYIWEACANMEEYVQIQFTKDIRHRLFGAKNAPNSLNDLININDVYAILKPKIEEPDKDGIDRNSTDGKQDIVDLINNGIRKSEPYIAPNKDEIASRFNSVCSFSNFLLIALRIQTHDSNVKLDDKRLIKFFEPYLNRENAEDKKNAAEKFVKDFGYTLLRTKFLYDKFILKREFKNNKEQWSLKRVKYYPEQDNFNYVNTFGDETDSNTSMNHRIIMILAMYHVSTPTQVYKYWLYAALNYLYYESNINPDNYLEYLEELARAYFFDRFVSTATEPESKEYETIIDINHGKQKNTSAISLDLLNVGTAVENFVFNYLDYLLWNDYQFNNLWFGPQGELKNIKDSRIANYEYAFRSSVEHYYPQQPNKDEGFEDLEKEYLDNFGNLCLLSSSKNSSLTNRSPKSKKASYEKSPKIDSIKQCVMMSKDQWWKDEIKEHANLMNQVFLAQLKK